MLDDPKIAGVVAGAAGGVIVAAFNAFIAWWRAGRERDRKRRYLALRLAHQLETYAIKCNDIVENFGNYIQPPLPEYPFPIENDAYEFLDHSIVDRYFQFSKRPNRENRSVTILCDLGHPSYQDQDYLDQTLNSATREVRDEAADLSRELRRLIGLRPRVMDW